MGPIDANAFSWQNPNRLFAEFIGFHTAEGQTGPTIITNGGYTPDFAQFPGVVAGYSHNHPEWSYANGVFVQMTDEFRLANRYPSQGDWNVLQAIASHYGPANPSLYLPDSWGVTREFKLTDRSYFQSLTPLRVAAGEGLSGREIGPNGCSQ